MESVSEGGEVERVARLNVVARLNEGARVGEGERFVTPSFVYIHSGVMTCGLIRGKVPRNPGHNKGFPVLTLNLNLIGF